MSRIQRTLALWFAFVIANPLMAQVSRVNPLEQVLGRVQAAVARGERPLVVLDLDDTLFRVSFRTRNILHDWAAAHPEAGDLHARIDALDPEKMPWSLPATLDQVGLKDPALRKSADRYWGVGFFSSRYLAVDETVHGAVVYVNRLARAGARLVYLTGRDTGRMYEGTVRALVKSGFPAPTPSGHVLMMKSDYKLNDCLFKAQACREIRAMGPVVASIDNEPRNCNMFRAELPGATIVCVNTPHSDNSPALEPGIGLVPDFRY